MILVGKSFIRNKKLTSNEFRVNSLTQSFYIRCVYEKFTIITVQRQPRSIENKTIHLQYSDSMSKDSIRPNNTALSIMIVPSCKDNETYLGKPPYPWYLATCSWLRAIYSLDVDSLYILIRGTWKYTRAQGCIPDIYDESFFPDSRGDSLQSVRRKLRIGKEVWGYDNLCIDIAIREKWLRSNHVYGRTLLAPASSHSCAFFSFIPPPTWRPPAT